MMKIKISFIILSALLLLTACNKNSYTIKGVAKDLSDGDTIYLSADLISGTPINKAVMKDGRFEMTGDVEKTHVAVLYSKNNAQISMIFFLEKGEIEVELSQIPNKNRVKGTATNQKMQEMTDSLIPYTAKIQTLFETEGAKKIAENEQAKQQIAHLEGEIKRLIKEKNKDEKQCPIREPDIMMVITGGEMAYKRDDGVLIVPIGCLKD